jgi:hypothetical protein
MEDVTTLNGGSDDVASAQSCSQSNDFRIYKYLQRQRFKQRPKENNYPKGENSPNLATL